MKIGGKVVGKKKGGKATASQYAKYHSGAYTPSGRKHGKSKSSSKAAKMYKSAMNKYPI